MTSGRSDGGTHHRGSNQRSAGGGAGEPRGRLGARSAEDVDYMEHARTIDEQYLTPLFTLQEGDRDGAIETLEMNVTLMHKPSSHATRRKIFSGILSRELKIRTSPRRAS